MQHGCINSMFQNIKMIQGEFKMRIVAGKHRSRILKSLDGDVTRPTSDKVKEAIFSRIGPYFDEGEMLDLFGGSGNISLEAISRGMRHSVIVDSSHKAIGIIKTNVKALKEEDNVEILKMDFRSALTKLAQEQRTFDFVFLDPPYKKQQIDDILTFLVEHQMLKADANVVCESLKEDTFQDSYGSLCLVKEATYGITKISYYRMEGELS